MLMGMEELSVSVPGLGTLQGSPRPWWAREQSRGCSCKQDFGPQGAVPAFGTKTATLAPKEPLWPPPISPEADVRW